MTSLDSTRAQLQGRRSWRVVLFIVATGIFLYWLEGGMPPRAWLHLTHMLADPLVQRTQLWQAYASIALLVPAWGIIALLLARYFPLRWLLDLASPLATRQAHTGRPRSTPGRSGLPTRELQGAQAMFAGREEMEEPAATVVQRGDAFSSSQGVPGTEGEDAVSLPFWSCSDPGREAYSREVLFTDWKLGSGPSPLHLGYFAIADGLPYEDEAGQNAALFLLSALRDKIIAACLQMRHVSEAALALLLDEEVQQAVESLGELLEREGRAPSMVLALQFGPAFFVANVGDTRAYLSSAANGFLQIAEGQGLLQPSHSRGSQVPFHRLTQAEVGRQALSSDVSLFAVTGQTGDLVLFCSSGLWSALPPAHMDQIMRTVPEPEQACPALLEAARKDGNTDPISMIVVPVA